jgi:SPP1 gp7 family putative phage head morphogenesis protein
MNKDLNDMRDFVLQQIGAWQVTVANELQANAFYDYGVSVDEIVRLVSVIRQALANGGGPEQVREAVRAAYSEGVARASGNISGLSDDYPWTPQMRLQDRLVLQRSVMAGSRALEQLKGFNAQTASDLSRLLFEAVQSGENPRSLARKIRKRFNVSKSRAERIARTEITMAHRRGRWDEAREAEEKFNIKTKLLHNSALIAGRTRRSHAVRHGKLFTREEEAAWYSINGNGINCLCSQTEVTVGPDGEPLFGDKLIARMEEQRARFIASGADGGKV